MDQSTKFVGEITRKDITKVSGIKSTLNKLGIDRSNSYCFGDGGNDIEMFNTVAHPIAIEEIKNLAEDVCDSVENDGVAEKLKELFN